MCISCARRIGWTFPSSTSGRTFRASNCRWSFRNLRSSDSPRRFDGAGMGLVVVRGLVDLLGGRIEVSSEVRQGAAFRVSLPAVSAEHVPERSDEEAIVPGMRKSRVLVGDRRSRIDP